MKISHTHNIFNEGPFPSSTEWKSAREQVIEAINGVYWPPGSDEFVINPQRKGNGVKPIADRFEENLDKKEGWEATGDIHFKTLLKERSLYDSVIESLAPYFDEPETIVSSAWFDGMKEVQFRGKKHLTVVEWETGNISSSHRSLNRIALGFRTGILTAGIIILPTRDLYNYLTDRVGNYPELEQYFPVWETLENEVENGVMEAIAVEHDGTSDSVPLTGKLKDGMSDRTESDLWEED